MGKWISTFHIAHARFFEYNDVENRTIRVVFPNNVKGLKARIKLGNRYGITETIIHRITIAACDKDGKLLSDAKDMFVNGKEQIKVPVKSTIMTDETDFSTHAGEFIALSMYFPSGANAVSGGNVGKYGQRSDRGEWCTSTEISQDDYYMTEMNGDHIEFDVDTPIPAFKSFELWTEEDVKVVTIAGDSITAMTKWSKPFTERLYEAYPGGITCGNSGISGNELMRDTPRAYASMLGACFGDSLMHRFEEDILSIAGLTHCIFQIGTNDIGYPGTVETDIKIPEAADFMEAYRCLVKQAKKAGVKTICLSIFPRCDELYSHEKEASRIAVNRALEESGIFDKFIDMDSILMNDNKYGLKEGYSLEDNLHISDLGGNVIAQNIPLNII